MYNFVQILNSFLNVYNVYIGVGKPDKVLYDESEQHIK